MGEPHSDVNIQIIVAGPGGGKTRTMIERVMQVLPLLATTPHKTLAFITYTNAATDEIRERLSRVMKIPDNVFIGTCHSFLIKFILEPFGHLLGLVPLEKYYIEKVKLTYTARDRHRQRNGEIGQANTLSNKGIIIFDKIYELALKILENPSALRIIGNRLAYLFVDEYQDTRIHMHNIVAKIVSYGSTNFYCIGDPLQSIYDFTYGISQIRNEKPKDFSFDSLPIYSLINQYGAQTIPQNYRSTPSIVALNNLYLSKIGFPQKAFYSDFDCPTRFINLTDKDAIYSSFAGLMVSEGLEPEDKYPFALILSYASADAEGVGNKWGYQRLNSSKAQGDVFFIELRTCLLAILGLKLSEAIGLMPGSNYQERDSLFRKFCLKMFREVIVPHDRERVAALLVDCFVRSFCGGSYALFRSQSSYQNIEINYSLEKLVKQQVEGVNKSFYSTIHSSKGLEADCVLVLARTNAEIITWLSFDQIRLKEHCRLGYVAFSRARKLLCLACLQQVSGPTKKLIEASGFSLLP